MKKCSYCGKDFEPKNPKGKFCSDKCRVYFSRKPKIQDLTKQSTGTTQDLTEKPPTTNYSVDTTTLKKKRFEELLREAKVGAMNIKEMNIADLTENQRDLLIRKNNDNKK